LAARLGASKTLVSPDVVVAGQLTRDLVLLVDEVPGPAQSQPVRLRREMLGGKGANQAVALVQLGLRPALVAVAGDDDTGTDMLAQARRDGIDVSAVVRRKDARTGLVVDIVDHGGRWHYLEDLPQPVLLTEKDVAAAESLFPGARWASIQLQQPAGAALAAAALAREAGCRVLLDGAPSDDRYRVDLIASASVLRADAREARALTGVALDGLDDARRAAAELLRQGPSFVALAVGDAGNYFAWQGQAWGSGELWLPVTPTPITDTTGAGDAFTAALIAGLDADGEPERAARLAIAAAGATVENPGGRPALTERVLADQLALLEAAQPRAAGPAAAPGPGRGNSPPAA
jgi:ribokinase